MSLIDRIASDDILDAAYQWLCTTRQHYHFNADVWHLRRWWSEKKPRLQARLRAGTYAFLAVERIRKKEEHVEWWSSEDALVLKMGREGERWGEMG